MTDHPEPIIRGRRCPPEMWPKPVARFVRKATDAGWDARVGIAIGYRRVGRIDSEVFRPQRLVWIEARRPGARIEASWVGPVDGSKMSFDGAWRYPGPRKLGARELDGEVDAL